jgi:hypothetical protein
LAPSAWERPPVWRPDQLAFDEGLLSGMRDLGYGYGEHYVTEPRGSEGDLALSRACRRAVRLKVDIILAGGPSVPALMQATTIPIVMAAGDRSPTDTSSPPLPAGVTV